MVDRSKTQQGSTIKRQSVKRYPSDKIMGKGSWVEFRKLTWGESKAFTIQQENDTLTAVEKIDQVQTILQEHIVDWNWVDDDGNKLPLPTPDNGVFEQLNDDETSFLVGLLNSTSPKP